MGSRKARPVRRAVRDGDEAGRGPDGVADVDVDVEGEPDATKGGGHGDAEARVLVLVANDVRGGSCGVENEPVVAGPGGDVPNEQQDGVSLEVKVGGEQVDVPS